MSTKCSNLALVLISCWTEGWHHLRDSWLWMPGHLHGYFSFLFLGCLISRVREFLLMNRPQNLRPVHGHIGEWGEGYLCFLVWYRRWWLRSDSRLLGHLETKVGTPGQVGGEISCLLFFLKLFSFYPSPHHAILYGYMSYWEVWEKFLNSCRKLL